MDRISLDSIELDPLDSNIGPDHMLGVYPLIVYHAVRL